MQKLEVVAQGARNGNLSTKCKRSVSSLLENSQSMKSNYCNFSRTVLIFLYNPSSVQVVLGLSANFEIFKPLLRWLIGREREGGLCQTQRTCGEKKIISLRLFSCKSNCTALGFSIMNNSNIQIPFIWLKKAHILSNFSNFCVIFF